MVIKKELVALKEEILQLYEDYDIIDKLLIRQLEELFPLPTEYKQFKVALLSCVQTMVMFETKN